MKKYLLVFALLISGCVSIGSQEAFVSSKTSGWHETKSFGDQYYLNKCNKESIKIYPVIVRHNVNFTGFILPIFPIMLKSNSSKNPLEIKFVSSGIHAESLINSIKINGQVSDFTISAAENGNSKIKLLNSSLTLEAIDSVAIEFNSNSTSCETPKLKLKKEAGFWHEIIWSMGP